VAADAGELNIGAMKDSPTIAKNDTLTARRILDCLASSRVPMHTLVATGAPARQSRPKVFSTLVPNHAHT
jgi:hypothetical protein